MGPEVAEDRKRNVDPLGPRLETGDIVGQHTQDLGVELREKVLQFLIRGELARSDRCERRWKESQQNVLFPLEVAEAHIGIASGRESKVRSDLSNSRFVYGL
jgi:hypothetical protein